MVEVFDLKPEFPAEKLPRRRGIRTPREQGMLQGKNLWTVVLDRWALHFHNAPISALTRLKALWELTSGPVLHMTWTPPGESAISVCFGEESLRWRRRATTWSGTVILEEVRG